ncbi:MAG TPA: hypothetical protein VJ901_20415, partial [Thermoanaerobaculia bacterium]|nr:hypothetical protein [Thermoanaerobaculia bacterium]
VVHRGESRRAAEGKGQSEMIPFTRHSERSRGTWGSGGGAMIAPAGRRGPSTTLGMTVVLLLLAGTRVSVRALASYIEENPDALLKGRGKAK